MHLSIESIAGEAVIDRQLLRWSYNLRNPTVALEIAAAFLRRNAQDQFDSEGGHGSGGWAALADSTVAEKDRLGLQPEILRATDALMSSLTRRSDSQHFEERLSPDSLAFGTRVPYAIYHDTGTSRMPQRKPIELTDGDKVMLVKELQRALINQRAGQALGAAGAMRSLTRSLT